MMTKSMMIVSTFEELRSARSILDDPVGLVPTMGYLHDGHLSLVRRAAEECASVVVSIFVNPTQFGPSEDLAAYPRDMERDLRLLESLGVDLVWTPTPEIMYPDGYQTWVQVEALTDPLEGAMRPGHFRGSRLWWPSCSTASNQRRLISGRKMPSRWPSSAAWPAT
jgi:pantoate--beta-alanine ligase